jgi:hypothetical protein
VSTPGFGWNEQMKHTKSILCPQDPAALISLIPGKLSGVYTVRLNLPFRHVFMGELRTQGEGTFSKRIDPSKHVHHNSESVAVSAALLHSESIPFRWIVCEVVGKGKLVTTRRFFIAHGESFRYRNFEPQIALAISKWGVDQAREWEAEQDRRERHRSERAAQTELFEAVA